MSKANSESKKNAEAEIQELMLRRVKIIEALRAARGMFLYDLEAELEDLDAEIHELQETESTN